MAKEMWLLLATSVAMEMLAQAIASKQSVVLRIITSCVTDHAARCLHQDACIVQGCSPAAEHYRCLQGSKLSM